MPSKTWRAQWLRGFAPPHVRDAGVATETCQVEVLLMSSFVNMPSLPPKVWLVIAASLLAQCPTWPDLTYFISEPCNLAAFEERAGFVRIQRRLSEYSVQNPRTELIILIL